MWLECKGSIIELLFLQIRAIDGIEFVEQEAMAQILGQQYNPTWGIDRIDSRDGIDGVYNFNDGG